MKVLLIVIISFSFISCNIEQEATEFNRLVKVPHSADQNYQTDEDQSITFEYKIESDKSSYDLQVEVIEQPQYGKLSGCDYSKISLGLKCTYTPNPDYSGQDFIKVRNKDGDFISDKSALITIDVKAINDAPQTIDGSQYGNYQGPIIVSLPKAFDSDSLTSELDYSIEDVSSEGSLSDCKLENGNRTCTLNINAGYKGSVMIKYSATDQESEKSNISTYEVMASKNDGVKTFTQGKNEIQKADIVWVIDNSGSMSDDQQTLKQNLNSFIDNFLENGKAKFPFKMGAITTDTYRLADGSTSLRTDSNGNILNLSSIRAETDFAAFKADFERAVTPGTNGAGDERAFESMQRSYVLNPEWYGGNDSLLVYIILSDEKEGSSSKTLDQWLTTFQSFKDNTSKLKVYPIIRLDQDREDRYKLIAEKTSSKRSDITQSFNSILNDISTEVKEAVTNLNIGESGMEILKETVVVSVNDQKLITGWTLENNKIILNPAPAPDSKIRVTFKYR